MNTHKLMALLPDMAAFVTVVEEGSFTKASQKLAVTPSAVSRQVSRLEAALATKLLERTTRTLSLSSSGKETFDLCLNMLEYAKQAVNSSSQSAKPSGELRVSAPKAFSKEILAPVLQTFLDQYPDINLKLKVSDLTLDPVRDEVDLVFKLTDRPSEGLISKPIGKMKLILCASPQYLKTNGTPKHPKELSNHQCIYLGEKENDNLWEFSSGNQKVKVAVTGRLAVNHSEMRLQAVERHTGIGLFTDFMVKEALKEGRVTQILSEWTLVGNYQGSVVMQYAQSKFIPSRLRVFVDYIIELNLLKSE